MPSCYCMEERKWGHLILRMKGYDNFLTKMHDQMSYELITQGPPYTHAHTNIHTCTTHSINNCLNILAWSSGGHGLNPWPGPTKKTFSLPSIGDIHLGGRVGLRGLSWGCCFCVKQIQYLGHLACLIIAMQDLSY